MKAYREERYIVLKEPRQAGVHRLSELAEADREGRCVVLERAKLEDIPFTYESLISKIIKSET